MRCLLDTHVILWIAFHENKISSRVRKLLLSNDAEIFLSAVSFWEISIKFQMGKLDLKHHTPETILTGFNQYFDFQNLDLKINDAASFFQLKQTHHKDPFDRMLIWQALQDDLTLISDDEIIKRYSDTGLKVIW
ncbi:PIN domain nuclease, a component of toxin-antitoxin system (PIN domain) [Cyclobacterium lianum]|uniref:PIN domain nuclease, a component of toxin-antitoxin system (PIN domain) n=1 Tax=Cyclobacterium lianum TaxID=388280 RepID=A0A1M7NR10_9BACT|nr:type II toxin-antitoxin system VapC family toxin [Cyclobacterium lianum]SHN06478.1 PIN domain nuclease, a component of toxin-antitoxin system (PIN domain) [Cyclobacterium lianum]